MKPLRKVWRYLAPELVDMSELKTGDLFQIQRRNDGDPIDESELHLALGDAVPVIPRSGSTHQVETGLILAKPFVLNNDESKG